MHQRYAHYNCTCLQCIHLINTETLEHDERNYYDTRENPYEMIITCSLNHCVSGRYDSEVVPDY